MGLPPTGPIIARPMVKRACGCSCEFQHYQVDKYRAQRLAKFQQSRCPECVAKLEDEQRKAAGPPKGEAMKALPAGTKVTLTLGADGNWSGALEAGGRKTEASGAGGAGPQSVVVLMARQWLAEEQKG
jgi:hypothetical protein